VLPQAVAAGHLLGALQRLGQRNLDLRIAEEAVEAPEPGDSGLRALLERCLQAARGVALRNTVQLG
jgi:hypothetical protein